MSSQLDPVILQKLRAFARRRRRLILLRGVLATLTTFSAAMLLVAAVDYWIPLLSDAVRWALSGTAYAAVIAVGWWQCLRPLWHAPDERQIARIVEHAEPELREDLLSAVELGHAEGAILDSAQFRALVQMDVAARVQDLRVVSLLPVGLLKRYINVAAIIGIVVVGLMLLSGLRFGSLLLRALMPGANLDRVSATEIIIIEPNPGNQTVPQGDAVRLVVELRGKIANTARLESEDATQGRHVAALLPLGNNRFATTIQVARQSVRYRVQAGDALTRRYELTAVARPHEVAFEKIYKFPEYAQYATKTVTEEGGGLAALEGTQVELKITTSQAVSSGELRVDTGKATTVIPLLALPDGRLTAKVPLTTTGSYRVHLVAAGTGFVNKFSPEYEIRAEPDLLPIIEFEEPTNDVVSPADELVQIVGHARDDIGLARVVQMVKVNEGEWKERELYGKNHGDVAAAPAGQPQPAKIRPAPVLLPLQRAWDLSEEGVRAGDMLTTKLVATDIKGSVAESKLVRIIVVAAAIEMQRCAGLRSRQALANAVKNFAGSAIVLEAAARSTQLKFDQGKDADPDRKRSLTELAKAYADYQDKLSQAWLALDVPLRDAPANHESSDLVLLGRLLSRSYNDVARHTTKSLELLTADPAAPAARELIDEIHQSIVRSQFLTNMALQTCQFNVAAEQIDVVVELGILLSAEQRRIRDLTRDAQTPEAWGKVATRLHAVLGVSKNLDTVLEALKTGGGPIAENAEGLLNSNFIAWTREKMERTLTTEPADERLAVVFEDFTRYFGKFVSDSVNTKVRLANLAQEAIITKGKIPVGGAATPIGLAASMHQYLTEELEPTWTSVATLRQELSSIAKLGKLSTAERADMSVARWNATSDIFKAHADLEEARAMADNAFVGDLRRATVASQAVQALANGDGPELTNTRLDVLDQSLRLLECGHNLQELIDGITALVAMDRWEIRMPHARTTMPRDGAWLATRLQLAPGQLKRLALTDDAARKAVAEAAVLLDGVRDSQPLRELVFEMGERRKFKHSPQVARSALEQLAGRLRVALAVLRDSMETARKNLAKLMPDISAFALALAKEEAAIKKDSNQQATIAATTKPATNTAQVRPQLVRQQQLNTKIEMLKDLIRADANQQNILKTSERDRMRDADDALAMLKDPPPQAELALLQVTQSTDAAQQQIDLDRAVEQEQKVVVALLLIGGHYEALEQGKNPAETRAALRQAELEAGIKDELDQAFAKAEMLAQMAEKSAEELLKELEAKLPVNPEMQTELDRLSKDALALASEELDRAAKAEAMTAEKISARVTRDKDPKHQFSALEAAMLAAGFTKEAQAAADAARQSLEKTTNKPGMDRAKTAAERAAAAVPLADQLVEAARRMEGSRNVEDVIKESNAVVHQANQMIQSSEPSRNESKAAAENSKNVAQKGGPQQADNQQAEQQATLSAEKSSLAIEAARQAEDAARDAAERAQAMAKIPQGAPQNSKLAQAAMTQAPVANDAVEAAADVGRAGRHADRLGDAETGQKLNALAAQVAETSQNDVPAAEKAIRESKQPADAQAPVQQAATELADEAAALKQAAKDAQNAPPSPGGSKSGKGAKPGEGPPGSPPAASPADQQEMARALDALDQQLSEAAAASAQGPPSEGPPSQGPPGQGPPGQGPPGQGPPGPMAGMSQSQMAAMRQGRATKPSPMPGMPAPFSQMEKSEGGAKLQAAAPGSGQVPEMPAMKQGDWGKLPKQLAAQLTKGQNDAIASDYREAIETYYRVIAEKSKKP
jgi:hypothetical protein